MFYYFLAEQARTLAYSMAERFAGGRLVFDAANRTAVKMIAKTWLKEATRKDVDRRLSSALHEWITA